ncbi:hypothetical protein BGZ73_000690, partial [Actinomortierella ambigua]
TLKSPPRPSSTSNPQVHTPLITMAISLKLKSNSSSSSGAIGSLGSTASTPRSSLESSAPSSKTLTKSSNVYRTSAYALANSRL